MKPVVDIDYNKIFVNTKFHDEMSSVIFGAELALEYASVSKGQSRDIKDTIVRSAFESFFLDYVKMAAAAHAQDVTISSEGPLADLSQSAPAVTADLTPPVSVSAPDVTVSAAAPVKDVTISAPAADVKVTAAAPDVTVTAAAPNVTVSVPAPRETPVLTVHEASGYDYGISAHADAPAVAVNVDSDYKAPSVNVEYQPADGGYEQTVVYENYPAPAKAAATETIHSNIWGEPVVKEDEGDDFGKIHWTTYSTGGDQAGQGDLADK